MKKFLKYICLGIFCFCLTNISVMATTKTNYINLETMEISINGKDYSKITEYDSLDDFLKDYNSNSLEDVYITNFLFDGVSEVKSPDLDDFIEKNSNDTKIKKLEIKVLNINNIGTYELTGKTKGTMIGVNTNDLKGNININLNNVEIDTDSKKSPAIYVYNKETTYTDCKVSINTLKNTKNYIEGGKLKKVSLLPSDKLNEYKNYYSNDNLTNYNNYTSYYGIYNSSEINNILFATVEADREDLNDGDPYYFYKASGAISSDIDLYFEGEGYLKVTSKNKEGIETKGNLSLIGGKGDYEVLAQDDCLNTTTANSSGTNVRNTLTINVNSLIAIVSDEGDEGDAIDSNGTLTINGGKIYAFAHSSSGDAGLDSENGTYINGGTIIATGNMSDRIANDSKQKYIYLGFGNKISAGTLVVVKDQKDNIITAFRTDKDISNLLYSSDSLSYMSLKVYVNGTIDGKEENGLYTKINSYENGEEISFYEISSTNNVFNSKENISKNLGIALIIEISLLVVLLIIEKMIIKKQFKI